MTAVVGIGDHLGRQLPVSLLVPVSVASVDTTVPLIKSVQQVVLMNSLSFTNMMHRTTITDQSGHGYHCVLLFNLMVLRL